MRAREGNEMMDAEIGVMSQGIQAASKSRGKQRTNSLLEQGEETQLCGYLDLDLDSDLQNFKIISLCRSPCLSMGGMLRPQVDA